MVLFIQDFGWSRRLCSEIYQDIYCLLNEGVQHMGKEQKKRKDVKKKPQKTAKEKKAAKRDKKRGL